MYFRLDLTSLSALLFVILTLGTTCRGQTCDIDFHMQSSSVMLMEGANASVLCDATCYGRDSGVDVFWRDTRGRQISFYPGRIFSVRYNRGLMNRLLVIRASLDTAGTYVCSVMRNGTLLQQKPLNFVFLGNNINNNNIRPVDTGPRRGDMIPESDIEYRPVRSVDWVASHLNPKPKYPDSNILARYAENVILHEEKHVHKANNYDNRNADNGMSYLLKMTAKSKQRPMRHSYDVLTSDQETSKIIDDLQVNVTKNKDNMDTSKAQNKNLLRNGFRRESNKLEGKLDANSLSTDNVLGAQILNGKNTKRSDSANNMHGIGDYIVHPRVKRMVTESTAENGTAITDMTDNSTTDRELSTTEEFDPSSGSSTLGMSSPDSSPTIYFRESSFSSVDTADVTEDKGKDNGDRKEEEKPTGQGRESTSPCYKSVETASNFGRYGVLAFAITLAVAFLLLYAILMIICMPRLMARRKNKADVEGATYRKKSPDSDDTTPFVALDGVGTGGADPNQGKQEITDLDKSTSQNDNDQKIQKDGDSVETSASVSTFLLRQESQNENKEGTTSGDNARTVNQPGKDVTATTTLDSNSTEPSSPDGGMNTEAKDAQDSGDLLQRILPELASSEPVSSTSQNQSENNNFTESQSDAGKTNEDPSIRGTDYPITGDLESDPPQPPPPDTNDILSV